jgi:hypothetical protein
MWRGYGARTEIAARAFNRSLASLRDDRRVVCARSLSFRTREARRNLLQPLAVHVARVRRENGDRGEGVQQVPRFASGRQARCVREIAVIPNARSAEESVATSRATCGEGTARERKFRRGRSTGPSLRFGTTGVCVREIAVIPNARSAEESVATSRRACGEGTARERGISARGFNRSLASLRDDRRARDRCHSERAKRGGICCNLTPCMPAKEQRENGEFREGVQQVPRFASGRQVCGRSLSCPNARSAEESVAT